MKQRVIRAFICSLYLCAIASCAVQNGRTAEAQKIQIRIPELTEEREMDGISVPNIETHLTGKQSASLSQTFYIESSGFKSWTDYTKFGTKTRQYQLQQLAETEEETGLRVVDERYCVAIGSYFGTEIGQCFDLVLKNGIRIPCVMSDQKADCDTDADGISSTSNGCVSEFTIDSSVNEEIRTSGDVSYAHEGWDSPVAQVIIYDKNLLKGGVEE
jgi:hypothetical protein